MTTGYHRSAGVTAAATFALLASASALLAWGYLLLPLLDAPPDSAGRHAYQNYPIEFAVFTFLPPLLIAFTVRTAIGILQLRPWARLAALVWAAAALTLCLAVVCDHAAARQLVVAVFLPPFGREAPVSASQHRSSTPRPRREPVSAIRLTHFFR